MTISILFSCFRHAHVNFLTCRRAFSLKHGSDRHETLPKRVSDDPRQINFRRKKIFSPRFFGLGNHFWHFWADFGSSRQKRTSSSTSSQFFALDGPIMSSVGLKLGENISVCALWTRHIVLFGKDTLCPVDRTHCRLSSEHNVFVEQNTLSFLD